MSDSLAIATVTEGLRSLLDRRVNALPDVDPDSDPALAGTQITTRPPDRARPDPGGVNQLNLFLYQTSPNAAWRNLPPPDRVRPGESAQPPLALDLHYLVTAYGRDDDDAATTAHRLMGRAMSVLHDHALLGRAELRDAVPDNDLHEQFERIRITPEEISLEELSRLWGAFQTPYRISTGYAVTVVLIDSTRPRTSPLPVLRRTEEDRGVHTVVGAGPTVREVRADVVPDTFGGAARLGTALRLLGDGLGGDDLVVSFANDRLPAPVEVAPEPAPATSIRGIDPQVERRVSLPAEADDGAIDSWVAGLYAVSVRAAVTEAPGLVSNAAPFALTPSITVDPSAAGAGDVDLTITCRPRLRDGQRVVLLFGSRQVTGPAVATPADPVEPSTVQVTVDDVVPGTYTVRLRVDGVDSMPLAAPTDGRTFAPEFDRQQQVVVT